MLTRFDSLELKHIYLYWTGKSTRKNYLGKDPRSSRKVVNIMIEFFSTVLILSLLEETILVLKNE